MLFGSALRAEISRSGRASPEERKADSTCDACTTALTRYGSRRGAEGDGDAVPLKVEMLAQNIAQSEMAVQARHAGTDEVSLDKSFLFCSLQ